MITLKKRISHYMYLITCILVVLILLILLCIQVLTEQNRAYHDATRTIQQIESLLLENQKEATEAEEEYRQTCIHNAEIMTRIIGNSPDILNDSEELKQIATSLEVDEIHIFNTDGYIFAGTHPQYYGLTFDSGEQITFFKPMLEDKSLQLVQDIMPNTAEGKPMQYSAVWTEDGKYIVQVGMEPIHVLKATEKNELSHIFSHFRVNPNADYYAINKESRVIIGSTNLNMVGLSAESIGIKISQMQKHKKGFHAKLNDTWFFCVFEQSGNNYTGRVIPTKNLYQRIPATLFFLSLSLIVVAFVLAQTVIIYMNNFVVKKIEELNRKLKSVANGNSEEVFDVDGSVEFVRLNRYIKLMVKNLVDSNKKMSYALSKTNMHIGIYEYGNHRKKLQYTEYIPIIFSLTKEQMEYYSNEPTEFQDFLSHIKENPINSDEDIYKYGERYIRLEEIESGDEIFGVAMDVTSQTIKRMKIEEERDIDTLTGLYNRRGLDNRLAQLFSNPDKLGYSALFMIDADGLKGINDTYGHEKGDLYLKKIGESISSVDAKYKIASRQGGDEFVLFLYGYENEEELATAIQAVENIRDNRLVAIDHEIRIPMRFSLGYCIIEDDFDYLALLKIADERMYQNKLERRKH